MAWATGDIDTWAEMPTEDWLVDRFEPIRLLPPGPKCTTYECVKDGSCVDMLLINKAYVPAITVCELGLRG